MNPYDQFDELLAQENKMLVEKQQLENTASKPKGQMRGPTPPTSPKPPTLDWKGSESEFQKYLHKARQDGK